MRVSVRYDERPHGLIFPRTMTYQVWTIDFSDQEKAIIQQRKLEDYTIDGFAPTYVVVPNLSPERWWHKLPWIGGFFPRREGDVTVREVLLHRTFVCRAEQPLYLTNFEVALKAGLEGIKRWIANNKDAGRSSVFEV